MIDGLEDLDPTGLKDILSQVVADADRDTVERHGGFDVVMETIIQWEQENPASNGREMIDDFRLRGSRTWRRRGGPLTKRGWLAEVAHQVAHALDHRNASLSEGFFSLLWTGPCLESLIGSGLARIARVGCDNRGEEAAGVSTPRTLRRAWRGRKWRERPPHFWRWCATGQGRWCTPKFTIPLHFLGRSLHSDPWREGH